MTKKGVLSTSLGSISFLVTAEFWVSYLAFCRFNKVIPFNDFVHRYPAAAGGLIGMMAAALSAGIVAAWFRKWWLGTSVCALVTLLFIFSQIT